MEIKTTANPGPPSTTVISDNPTCTCCTPVQPLIPPDTGQTEYECPVTGLKYTFDPAEGVVKGVASDSQRQSVETAGADDLFPRAPRREEVRRVNPDQGFA